MGLEEAFFEARAMNGGLSCGLLESLPPDALAMLRSELLEIFHDDVLRDGMPAFRRRIAGCAAALGVGEEEHFGKICKVALLYPALKRSIVGQDHVLPKVCRAVASGLLSKPDPARPRPKSSMMFLGPTGVGKTELALEFTRVVFDGDESRLARLDMSEFYHGDSYELFAGRPGEPGRVGEALVRIESGGTLLLDEIEKANREIMKYLLQMLDAGRITCGDGRIYSTANVYIVLTSNIGAERIMRASSSLDETVERYVRSQLYKIMRPETVGRLNLVCVFRRLEMDSLRKICRQFVDIELARIKRDYGYDAEVSEAAFELMLRLGTDLVLGARPTRTTVAKLLGDAVTSAQMKGHPKGRCLFERHPHTEFLILVQYPQSQIAPSSQCL